MTKVVINRRINGGFALSSEAKGLWMQRTGRKLRGYYSRTIRRDDPDLVAVVEQLGESASTHSSQLEIVEIPDGIDFQIEKEQGREWVAEKHRTWGKSA